MHIDVQQIVLSIIIITIVTDVKDPSLDLKLK